MGTVQRVLCVHVSYKPFYPSLNIVVTPLDVFQIVYSSVTIRFSFFSSGGKIVFNRFPPRFGVFVENKRFRYFVKRFEYLCYNYRN